MVILALCFALCVGCGEDEAEEQAAGPEGLSDTVNVLVMNRSAGSRVCEGLPEDYKIEKVSDPADFKSKLKSGSFDIAISPSVVAAQAYGEGGKNITCISPTTLGGVYVYGNGISGWGFTPKIFKQVEPIFAQYLKKNYDTDPMTCEHVIPTAIGELIKEKVCTVKVLSSTDHWFGVTYKEDKPEVEQRVQKMKDDGIYPDVLWE